MPSPPLGSISHWFYPEKVQRSRAYTALDGLWYMRNVDWKHNIIEGRGSGHIRFMGVANERTYTFYSERSEVPTRVLVTLAWFPEFRKSRSRPLEHHRPAFAVYQLLIRLLTCYRVSQSRAMLRLA